MTKLWKILKNPVIYLILILILAFIVRLYKIDNPIADWHSWRQADTAAVARNFYQEGFNPLYPKGDDMSTIAENGLPNISRLRFVEFPIYPSLIYFTYILNGGVDEKFARLISIIFSLGSIVFIYFLTRKYFDEITAFFAAFMYGFLPYSIFYSRVILPEPSLVFFGFGTLYFADRWIREKSHQLFWISLFFSICALLTKPMSVFYFLPLIYSYYQVEGKIFPVPGRYILWLVLSILPFIGWRLWISQSPDSIPASRWLLNGNNIRFKPVFWQWILVDRFGREILGITGTVLFFIGFLLKPNLKQGWLLHLLAMSSFLYLIVFATGNVQHDYYQTLILPALVIFTARGFVQLAKGVNNFLPRIITFPLAILFFSLIFYFTWGEIKGLYQVNNWAIVEGGKVADKILPQDAVVLAPYQGDTAFLYQINRNGFPFQFTNLAEMKSAYKVTHLVSTTKDARTVWAMKKYTVLVDNPNFVIVDLHRDNPLNSNTTEVEP